LGELEREKDASFHRSKINESTFTREKRKKKKQPTKSQNEEDDDEEEGDIEWVVEAVEDEKLERGRNKFLVRWEGYEQLTWESEKVMENARGKIEEFRKKKQKNTVTREMLEREQHESKEEKHEGSEKEEEEVQYILEQENEEVQYTVERVLEMKVQNAQKSFLIKWEGYEKPTWEPETHLDKEMIRAFEVERVKTAVCVFCKNADGAVARYCEICGKTMHHFCATDACVKMKIPAVGSTQQFLTEFGDLSYCSKKCYEGKLKRKQQEIDSDSSISEENDDGEEEDKHPETGGWSKSKATRTLPKKKRKQTPESNTTSATEKPPSRNPKPAKEKPPSSTSKFDFYLKHVAFMLKDERKWMAPKKEDEKKFAGLADTVALIGIIKSRRLRK